MLQIVCCRCDKYIGQKPGGNGITHGFCDSCEKEQLSIWREEIRKLENIKVI